MPNCARARSSNVHVTYCTCVCEHSLVRTFKCARARVCRYYAMPVPSRGESLCIQGIDDSHRIAFQVTLARAHAHTRT